MQVHLLTPEQANWGFDGEPPHYVIGAGGFKRNQKVDPAPAYAPDKALVDDLVAECCERFPLTRSGAAGVYLLSHEFLGRTNALTFEDYIYDGQKESVPDYKGVPVDRYPQAHTIALSAKRIPIMPAMLRYLVAHEYGHAAWNYVARWLGYSEAPHELERIYMEMRGGSRDDRRYGCGRWHAAASEIIANDFRILVMQREVEFWPHEVPRPEQCGAIRLWWQMAREIGQ